MVKLLVSVCGAVVAGWWLGGECRDEPMGACADRLIAEFHRDASASADASILGAHEAPPAAGLDEPLPSVVVSVDEAGPAPDPGSTVADPRFDETFASLVKQALNEPMDALYPPGVARTPLGDVEPRAVEPEAVAADNPPDVREGLQRVRHDLRRVLGDSDGGTR